MGLKKSVEKTGFTRDAEMVSGGVVTDNNQVRDCGPIPPGISIVETRQWIRKGLMPFMQAAETSNQLFLAYLISMAIEEAGRPLMKAKKV